MALDQNAQPGDIYQREDGALYRVVGYQPNPTVILEQMTDCTGEPDENMPTETHAVGCLNAEHFSKIGAFHKSKNPATKEK